MQNISPKSLLSAALCAVIVTGTTSFAQAHKDTDGVSTSELLRVLRIKTFRVRTPKDPRVWDLEIIKQSEVKPLGKPDKLGSGGLGLLALRDTGDDVYEFTLPEHGGAFSQGKFELCRQFECAGQYSTHWLKAPRYSSDGTQCLLAELENLGEDHPSAYIALVQVRSHP